MKWTVLLIYLSICFSSYAQFDIPPEPVGGIREAKRVLSHAFCVDNISHHAIQNGRVDLTFIIYKDGSTDSLNFAHGVNHEIDVEIARVFPLIQWLPGMIDSFNVSAWHLFEFRVTKKFYQENNLCMADIESEVYKFSQCDVQPEFSKGDFNKYVYQNLTYPPAANRNNIEGTVLVRFVVEKNGRLSNVGISKSVGGGCDQEAMRVVRNSKWKPGKINGKLVRTQVYYPITFKLGSSKMDIQGRDMTTR